MSRAVSGSVAMTTAVMSSVSASSAHLRIATPFSVWRADDQQALAMRKREGLARDLLHAAGLHPLRREILRDLGVSSVPKAR